MILTRTNGTETWTVKFSVDDMYNDAEMGDQEVIDCRLQSDKPIFFAIFATMSTSRAKSSYMTLAGRHCMSRYLVVSRGVSFPSEVLRRGSCGINS